MYGGRVAEELVFGHGRVTTGAASDIQQATALARRYVSQWGLSEAIGPILVGDNEQELFLGRELQTRREVSERTAQLVDSEVTRVIKEAYTRAKETLTENIDLLHRVAAALLDRETLTGDEVQQLARGEELPPRATPPSLPPAPAKEGSTVPQAKPAKPPLFGGPEVAPA
jgi:cell division protease FtsH